MKKTLICLLCVIGAIAAHAQTVVLKKGTQIPVKSTHSVELKNASTGQAIDFQVSTDIVADGIIVIPRGTHAKGKITKVSHGSDEFSMGAQMAEMMTFGLAKKTPKFKYKLVSLFLPNGNQIPLSSGIFTVKGDFLYGTEAMGKLGADITVASNKKPVNSVEPNKVQQNKTSVAISDIDQNIPMTSSIAENTFAVIIANEKYSNESQVEYAINDGRTFKEYCRKTLGIPDINIHFRENATKNNIEQEIDWVTKVAEAFGSDAQIIIYYAGHGIPDEKTSTAYLLPVDGIGNNVRTGYSLVSLYDKLSSLPARNVIVLMDACFSGTKRGEGMLTSARGVAIRAKATQPQGNLLVFSAAQGEETAYPYQEKSHGMFTYFLLKKLQETKGNCTLGELSDYVKSQVARRSIVVNGKSQTPTMEPSPSLTDNWRKIKLR